MSSQKKRKKLKVILQINMEKNIIMCLRNYLVYMQMKKMELKILD